MTTVKAWRLAFLAAAHQDRKTMHQGLVVAGMLLANWATYETGRDIRPSRETLVEALGGCPDDWAVRRYLTRSIARLIELGWLARTRTHAPGRTAEYALMIPVSHREADAVDEQRTPWVSSEQWTSDAEQGTPWMSNRPAPHQQKTISISGPRGRGHAPADIDTWNVAGMIHPLVAGMIHPLFGDVLSDADLHRVSRTVTEYLLDAEGRSTSDDVEYHLRAAHEHLTRAGSWPDKQVRSPIAIVLAAASRSVNGDLPEARFDAIGEAIG